MGSNEYGIRAQSEDEPICSSANYCGDMNNHGGYDVRPEAFDLDNMAHQGGFYHELLSQSSSDPIYSSAGRPQ
jgi:hypothetical protein